MKLIDTEVKGFLDLVDSKSPAPGGGSVAALAGALGVSLARMVGHLTISKKKFLELPETVRTKVQIAMQTLEGCKDDFVRLIDADTDAFNLVMAAYQMPKATDDEIRLRKARIVEGTIHSIQVPKQVAATANHALEVIGILIEYGNQNTLSDQGVAVTQLFAAVEGAVYNILINLPGLDDEATKITLKQEANAILHRAKTLRDRMLETVETKLGVD